MKYSKIEKRFLLLNTGVFLFVAVVVGSVVLLLIDTSPSYDKVVGQWVRATGGYVLDIQNIDDDGKLQAAYLNPRSINISKAQANINTGQIELLVELKDKHYPGNYYTLVYNVESDRLVGVYHHLGLGQDLDVVFSRKPGTM
jgi:hypothetical protein